MAAKKYPIGTSIKYIGGCEKCKGKTGKIVGVQDNCCYIALPQSTCSSFDGRDRILTIWSHIEPFAVKGQQLLFDFMCQNA